MFTVVVGEGGGEVARKQQRDSKILKNNERGGQEKTERTIAKENSKVRQEKKTYV